MPAPSPNRPSPWPTIHPAPPPSPRSKARQKTSSRSRAPAARPERRAGPAHPLDPPKYAASAAPPRRKNAPGFATAEFSGQPAANTLHSPARRSAVYGPDARSTDAPARAAATHRKPRASMHPAHPFPPTPSHAPTESAKTTADRRSCSAVGPIEKMSPLSFPATLGSPPAHTSSAAPAPARPPPASSAHKSVHLGLSSSPTSPRTASTAHTSDCSLLASPSHNGCRSARTSAPLRPTATYSPQSPAFFWHVDLVAAKQCPRPSPSG